MKMGNFRTLFSSKSTVSRYELQTYAEDSPHAEIYIPELFERTILKHIICNNTATSVSNFQYPLLLGIQGPYGYGKTFMVKQICRKNRILLSTLSSSDLSGGYEGDSKKHLKSEYEKICFAVANSNSCGAMLIDDFHLTIATEENVGKTVNSNLLASYLMNLCDNPEVDNIRVPIIMTGNNYRRVYPALLRDGRMDILTWSPSIEDITPIIQQIFHAKFEGIDDEVILSMIRQYADMNLAFFEQVSQDLMNSTIAQTIGEFKENKGVMTIAELSDSVKKSLPSIELTEERLLDVCRIRKEAILIDFESQAKIRV